MALFSSVFRQLFERFAHFLRRRETPLRAQQCAAQERKEKERQVKRKVKKEREMNEGGSHKDKAEKGRETLSLEKIKDRGHVPQKKRESAKFTEMQSLENLMEGGSEHREEKRKLKEQKTTEPTPLLVEVKPQQTLVSPPVRSSFLKPIEGELPVLPSVSEHLPVPAVRFKPLPPVTRPPIHPQKPAPAPEEVSLPCSPLQVYPPKPLAVPPRPTPAPDELFSLRRSQVSPPRQLVVPQSPTPESDEVVDLPVKPQPSTSSLFEPPPQLMLIDIEDEETEYVEYTGKTFRACDLPKSESPRPLEAEMKPRQMIAWLESDCEVLEEVWASEVVGVQGFEEVKDNPDEMGDSKEMDEHMMKLFCVTSPKGPKNETQHNVNVQQEPKSKRKVPLFLFTWAEEKAKKKEQKKIRKEKQRREKELLLERYRNDPKLKHLLINKHNHHYCSSE
uniref:Pollen-specific leucine-rich repeat extensin-like protein 1 n=1 Tax=Sinocyclocheilus rhinocerous TaxID=307959 RepID=A0A673JEI2_9TELE